VDVWDQLTLKHRRYRNRDENDLKPCKLPFAPDKPTGSQHLQRFQKTSKDWFFLPVDPKKGVRSGSGTLMMHFERELFPVWVEQLNAGKYVQKELSAASLIGI